LQDQQPCSRSLLRPNTCNPRQHSNHTNTSAQPTVAPACKPSL
jgi:hypothetical protein